MRKLRVFIRDFVKKHKFIRKIARFILLHLRRFSYKLTTVGCKTDSKTVVFACFQGLSYCDSPKAIYEHIKALDAFKDFRFIWAFKEPENYDHLKDERTSVIKIDSKAFLKTLGRAKYWIFNYKIRDHIDPKKDQIFVQCWHGTPLKRLGCDLENFENAMNTLSEIRKRYNIETKKFSYFLSPSAFASEKFISAWNMKESGKESGILEEGYPRNDLLKNYTEEDVLRVRKALGIAEEKKVILYAPTYRDNQHSVKSGGYTYKTEVDFDRLRDTFSNEYVILFRPHWLVAREFDFEKYRGFVYDVSGFDDISELYIISDLLITDYSSVFFDYANLKRPIVFYMYDLEAYRDDIRGFYLDINELPGPIVTKEDELIEEIKKSDDFEYGEKYKAFNDTYNYLDDGQASARASKIIFDL